ERNRARCGRVKTLLHRVEPIDIEKAFVDPKFQIKKTQIEGRDFPEHLIKRRNVVVVGLGGAGKSIFLKMLFLSLCDHPFERIPIFIELRDLNQRDDKNLFEQIYNQWSELIPSFTKEAMESGLRSGKFWLLFDALDEVDRTDRDAVSRQILEFSYKFATCP